MARIAEPVQSSVKPGDVRALLPSAAPEEPEPFEALVRDLDTVLLPGITQWQSPGWFAYFPANTSPPSIPGAIALLRLSRPTTHRSSDRVRVWHVREKQPYFVSYCDCGWVGTAYDATEPNARDKAFHEGREHSPDVAPEVEHPLG